MTIGSTKPKSIDHWADPRFKLEAGNGQPGLSLTQLDS